MYVNPKSSFNSYVLRSRKEYGLVSRHRLQLLRSTNQDGQDQDDIRRVTHVKYNALTQHVKKVHILESLKLLTDMYGIFLAFILRY